MFDFSKVLHSDRAAVMAILNVTPDSFSDGGKHNTVESALACVREYEKAGADIIDIGGCSTAPMNEIASEEEELSRLKSVLPFVVKNTSLPISVDTFRSNVAAYALANGAAIVNDESGAFLPEMAKVVKKYSAGWIFMHTGGCSSKEIANYENGVVNGVLSFFSEMKKNALAFGISENSLCYDYGIGFGKTRSDDFLLLQHTAEFREYNPLLVGVSRKRIIGELTGRTVSKDRMAGSVAAALFVSKAGAGIVRVHDVKETVDALKVFSVFEVSNHG